MPKQIGLGLRGCGTFQFLYAFSLNLNELNRGIDDYVIEEALHHPAGRVPGVSIESAAVCREQIQPGVEKISADQTQFTNELIEPVSLPRSEERRVGKERRHRC